MGGWWCIFYYMDIASNGLRVLIDEHVDFSNRKNVIIAASYLGGFGTGIADVVLNTVAESAFLLTFKICLYLKT